MHPNANIAFQRQEARRLLHAVLTIQPRLSGGAAGSPAATSDQIVGALAAEILSALPPDLDPTEAAEGALDLAGGRDHGHVSCDDSSAVPAATNLQQQSQPHTLAETTTAEPRAEGTGAAAAGDATESAAPSAPSAPAKPIDSLAVVLGQELERFRRLAAVLRASLAELQRAIRGQVVMSSELEGMYHSLLNNQVPRLWAQAAYPSLKPLASWVADYHARVAFMREWLTKGPPPCFWLPGER